MHPLFPFIAPLVHHLLFSCSHEAAEKVRNSHENVWISHGFIWNDLKKYHQKVRNFDILRRISHLLMRKGGDNWSKYHITIALPTIRPQYFSFGMDTGGYIWYINYNIKVGNNLRMEVFTLIKWKGKHTYFVHCSCYDIYYY